MSEQHLIIKMKDGKPLVSSEMKAAVMGEFYIEVDQADFISSKEYIPWDTCKEIYQAMLAASIGNVGEIKTEERTACVEAPRSKWIPCLSVLYQIGPIKDRVLLENFSNPNTWDDYNGLILRIIKVAKYTHP